MKSILVLQGSGNYGKTSTLAMVETYVASIAECKNVYSKNYKSGDFVSVWELKDGTKIGFNSAGDDYSCVNRIVKQLSIHNCDIIFCAFTSSKQNSVQMFEIINNYSKEHEYEVIYIQKEKRLRNSQFAEQKRENGEMAKHLIQCAFASYKNFEQEVGL